MSRSLQVDSGLPKDMWPAFYDIAVCALTSRTEKTIALGDAGKNGKRHYHGMIRQKSAVLCHMGALAAWFFSFLFFFFFPPVASRRRINPEFSLPAVMVPCEGYQRHVRQHKDSNRGAESERVDAMHLGRGRGGILQYSAYHAKVGRKACGYAGGPWRSDYEGGWLGARDLGDIVWQPPPTRLHASDRRVSQGSWILQVEEVPLRLLSRDH